MKMIMKKMIILNMKMNKISLKLNMRICLEEAEDDKEMVMMMFMIMTTLKLSSFSPFKVVYMVFTPSLIFACLANTITLNDIISW